MKSIGGNSGYIGYSESVRSYSAKLQGKFPKTFFKKEFGLSEKIFNNLLDRQIVKVSEWHHTSKFGNKTDFYSIIDPLLFYMVTGEKKLAFQIYKQTRNYEKNIVYNNKKLHFKYSIILKKGAPEVDILKKFNLNYNNTKRGNFEFRLNSNQHLQFKEVREIFNKNYKSENLL